MFEVMRYFLLFVGVRTPTIYFVDEQTRCIYMEFIENSLTAHELIGRLQSQQALEARGADSASSPEVTQALQQLAERIGALVASLHRQSTLISCFVLVVLVIGALRCELRNLCLRSLR